MGRFFHYFAYGSNMHPLRLGLRTPSCLVVGPATLLRHSLRFHKRAGAEGDVSGKCDAFYTGRAQDAVHGVLFRVHEPEREHLDEAEGNGFGYHGVTLRVNSSEGALDAYGYVADQDWIDEGLLPYDLYVALVGAGARIHGLPAGYQARLRAVSSIRDPDRERAERFFEIARGTRKIRPFFRRPRA